MKAGTFLLYADLQPEGLQKLDEAASEAETKETLISLLNIPTADVQRLDVILELYINTLRFAREQGFTVEKTSTFFSIIKRNHEEMAEAFLPPRKSWDYFQSLLASHSVQRPPFSVGIFTLAELQLITQFALDYYYLHFKLYRYAFTLRHVKSIDVRTSWAELPPDSFPSLLDGVPIEAPEPDAVEEAPPPSPPVEMPPIALQADVPPAVREAVEGQIAAQVAAMRAQLESQYAERTAAHEAKIKELEATMGK